MDIDLFRSLFKLVWFYLLSIFLL